MSLERWDPLGDMMSLRDAMDRLLHESFVLPGGGVMGGGRQSLPLDVVENDDTFVVSAWMPGVKPEDLQITVQGNTLTIRGETSFNEQQASGPTQTRGQRQEQPQGQAQGQRQGQMQGQGQDQAIQRQGQQRPGNWIMRERRHGTFYRAVSLPAPVNADGATSQFERGELVITLPKAEEAKPKQIRIAGTQANQIGQPSQPGQSNQPNQFNQPGQSTQGQVR